jgi:hypothetical protein
MPRQVPALRPDQTARVGDRTGGWFRQRENGNPVAVLTTNHDPEVPVSTTTYEAAIDTVRDAGETLLEVSREVGGRMTNDLQLPHLHVPNVHLPDVLDRTRRSGARRVVLVGGAAVVLAALVILVTRRRAERERSAGDERLRPAA